MRYFSNLYAKFQFTESLGFLVGFDAGIQESGGRASNATWVSPLFIAQYTFTKKLNTAFRAEYYQDPFGVIVPNLWFQGFETTGFSLNLDYTPVPPVHCRIEGRLLQSGHSIFSSPEGPKTQNFFITTSMAIDIPSFK